MDQQNEQKAPLTPEEIARLEAEAVAAMQRGERPSQGRVPSQGEAPSQDKSPEQPEVQAPAKDNTPPDFVPYVDDVPPEPKAEAPAEIEPEGDDEEYVPSPWEERVNALTEKQWRWTQIIGGALLGLVALAILYFGSEELATYRMIVAALLALLLPRYLERAWRRKLTTARYAMAAAMLVGLAVMAVVMLTRGGITK